MPEGSTGHRAGLPRSHVWCERTMCCKAGGGNCRSERTRRDVVSAGQLKGSAAFYASTLTAPLTGPSGAAVALARGVARWTSAVMMSAKIAVAYAIPAPNGANGPLDASETHQSHIVGGG